MANGRENGSRPKLPRDVLLALVKLQAWARENGYRVLLLKQR